ncbi:hypothetical protein [Piscinibacter sp. XHJ-5]|uniref:hypothetical protein n=1 Tax=Piscinibacter sp. XHJ-5 TaxID=3037797 RepID=UPI0024537358|nr:hypothetical protein [Piscinibacter sp. XHJ-5]
MLQLREAARDGIPLTVWVSSVAIEAARSSDWARLLDVQPLPALSVRLRGRFVRRDAATELTADIHFPEDITVRRCSPLSAGA